MDISSITYAATTTASTTPDIQQVAVNLIQQVLTPVMACVHLALIVISVLLFKIGIHRLKHHGSGGQSYKRLSPLATAAYFFMATVCLSYIPVISALGNSLFGNIDNYHQIAGSNLFAYLVTDITKNGSNNTELVLSDTTYAILIVVGMISFFRGVMMSIRMGEGQGQEGTVPKMVTHLLAGAVGVNAHAVYTIFQSTLSSTTGVST